MSLFSGPPSAARNSKAEEAERLGVAPHVAKWAVPLPTAPLPYNNEKLTIVELQILGDCLQCFRTGKGAGVVLEREAGGGYERGVVRKVENQLVRKGLLIRVSGSDGGVLPTQPGVGVIMNQPLAQSRLEDQGRDLLIAAGGAVMIPQASSALVDALRANGRNGVASLGDLAREFCVEVVALARVAKKLVDAERISVSPAAVPGDFELRDSMGIVEQSQKDLFAKRTAGEVDGRGKSHRGAHRRGAFPAVDEVTSIVRDAGDKGASISDILKKLQELPDVPPVPRSQLHTFLSNPAHGFVPERLPRRRAEGDMVLYRLRSSVECDG